MSTKTAIASTPTPVAADEPASSHVHELLKQYGCGPVPLLGSEETYYDRHLVRNRVIDPNVATARERFEALASSVRDILAQRWALTKNTYLQRT